MKRNELTKTFMMTSNLKKPVKFKGLAPSHILNIIPRLRNVIIRHNKEVPSFHLRLYLMRGVSGSCCDIRSGDSAADFCRYFTPLSRNLSAISILRNSRRPAHLPHLVQIYQSTYIPFQRRLTVLAR